GRKTLEGTRPSGTRGVANRPRPSVVTSRSQVLPDGFLSAYANAGRPAASSVRPAGPNESRLGGRTTTRSFPPRLDSAIQEPFSASTSTLVRSRPSTTRPARTGLVPGTRPARTDSQPPPVRRATTTSRPDVNATRGDPSRATASSAWLLLGATISALATPGRARAARPVPSQIHANLTEHRFPCIRIRATFDQTMSAVLLCEERPTEPSQGLTRAPLTESVRVWNCARPGN